jgi:hypothetical protein
MEFFRMTDGGFVTPAFLGQDVQNHWDFAGLRILENIDQERQVVSIDRTNVAQSHFLENQAAAEPASAIRAFVVATLLQSLKAILPFGMRRIQRSKSFWKRL